MNHRLLFRALFLSLVAWLPAQAQHPDGPQPLAADPARAANARPAAATARRPAALALPFFEDFAAQREGNPVADRWEARGGTLINNRFAVAQPTKGVATFDGIDANGAPYGSTSSFGTTDSLTSQPINLGGLAVGSNTYLSFYWQAGSIVGAPNTFSSTVPVFLQLEFLDNTGRWTQVWQQRSTGVRTAFQQQFVAVNDAKYFHANFQFRFRSSGRKATTQDSWSVDYVLLDTGRDINNTAYRDVALGQQLTSFFKRYSSLPTWQYNAAANPTLELNDSVATTVNNLDAGPAPTPYIISGTVQQRPSGPVNFFLSPRNDVISPLVIGQPLQGSARNAPLSTPAAAQTVRYSMFLGTTGPLPPARTLPNDTVSREAVLSNYYAFDDGTPEAVDGITETTGPTSYRAYRLVLNRADQITALRIYLTQPLVSGFSLTAAVWEDQGGQPAAQPKAVKAFQLPASVPAGQWFDVTFDQPVPVSGTCYFGYGQIATSQFIRFGLDLNSKVPAGFFWRNIQGTWAPFAQLRGAPMLRAVMSGVVTSTRRAAAADAPQVYPNPSHGLVQVAGRYQQARVLDALGRVVWQQPLAEADQSSLDLRQLTPGVYLLQLTLPDASVSTHRLLLEK
ncbi:T9SS type A sorting domain-containing protein [Hymenobacter busanensis]|uniref:T9SS type A sorting domain-containing protein n=1 Tax=Hymenobacter busanensis TaxID=2607656 RepID=A0A7L4ZVJ0_9BACT|nr:T9SS type A sorting domain-containing protein [Hymenobacter busanensis]KAA9339201.1 T9SS type A sorting domain-containing protein [Hymenobacter busanensis]QHJ07037.1 T9SS type A sorting domain-containing protein [Hymenobacter busanensis]